MRQWEKRPDQLHLTLKKQKHLVHVLNFMGKSMNSTAVLKTMVYQLLNLRIIAIARRLVTIANAVLKQACHGALAPSSNHK
ncbi:hypothetical protein [Acetobacter musti]|uniref:hypothetical protein n=1 Tax=Acetobacter musti TaxID=864732 RepID=UPI001A7EBA4A|nr:hypothetical protein [Acetobacter musti]